MDHTHELPYVKILLCFTKRYAVRGMRFGVYGSGGERATYRKPHTAHRLSYHAKMGKSPIILFTFSLVALITFSLPMLLIT